MASKVYFKTSTNPEFGGPTSRNFRGISSGIYGSDKVHRCHHRARSRVVVSTLQYCFMQCFKITMAKSTRILPVMSQGRRFRLARISVTFLFTITTIGSSRCVQCCGAPVWEYSVPDNVFTNGGSKIQGEKKIKRGTFFYSLCK